MSESSPKVPRKPRAGCAAIFFLGVFLVFVGPRLCNYAYARSIKNEFHAHRSFYESLIKQIESEAFPRERYYVLSESRYSGEMKRLEPDDSIFEAVFSGRSISASRSKGVLTVKIGIRVSKALGISEEHGVAYCSGELPKWDDDYFERIDDRWWYWARSSAR